MPLVRRVPKRGFTHLKRAPLEIVNLKDLSRFPLGSVVDPVALAEAGLVRSKDVRVKILGDGSLSHPLNVKAHQFSESALEKIAQAGGSAQTC